MKPRPIAQPLPGEHLAAMYPAEAGDAAVVWHRRLNLFTGRTLTANALGIEQTGRAAYAAVVEAADAAGHGETSRAVGALERLFSSGPPSVLGWTLPVDPCLRPAIGDPGIARLLARLAERAR